MLKVFFSQPFHGRTEEDIFEERRLLRRHLRKVFGQPVWIVDQYHQNVPNDNEFIIQEPKIWYLSQDILMLADADVRVFAHNWEESSGCRIEMEVCKKFRLEYTVLGPL